ncbi:hypothetical protein FSP39_020791 [Pinctada imbricata]|uniref:ATP-dependent DNA helicase n=1 Tax=Pinctada imbricata TaxID=66713 RepID=A0AA88YP82_PINIB|nr:hypothetical protein FSP39_020791 [Pinctada imbricata]
MASLLKKADEGHNLLITGPPGTGKTHVLAKIVERFLIDGKQVAVTSTTGISATILKSKLTSIAGPDVPPVTTIHRFCGLADGRHQNEELVDLLMHSEYYDGYRINICTVQALIIDEISMLSCKLLHQIEHIFRRIRRVEKPFGGVQVVLAGDFLQLPPVPTPEYGDDGQSITESILLQYFHCEQLSEIFRQSEPDLIQAIHEIARYQCQLIV